MSDGEAELSPSQILERVKPDRVAVTKPEEDRRRRTIIVEKKNGSYGFTLQSYGIHYKREQEIEMITYVDYVDYDGPAFRAGMREGDVILSINGHDMEKTDHKTLVNFIKNCDSRMRMVVLFEDCVRKVELHMRYIQLQRILQGKMVELERLCLRERELLQGKWKTHSLPARKKTSTGKSVVDTATPSHPEMGEVPYCRPTVSTEDVARAQSHVPVYPTPNQLLLAYQYIDAHGRAYFIHPTATPSSSGEYLVSSWQSNYSSGSERERERKSSRHRERHHHSESRRCSNSGVAVERDRGYTAQQTQASQHNGVQSQAHKPSKGERSHHQLCNPCLQASPQDNTSLEAYDLASPCCNSHCVPTSRRRSRHHKSSHDSTSSSRGEYKEKCSNRAVQVSSSSYKNGCRHAEPVYNNRGNRYLSLVSQCSLHSCTSSELNSGAEGGVAVASGGGGGGGESSGASYTTSLSTDTLYWEPPSEAGNSRHHSVKSHRTHHEPAKPKSWDNLTTKAFGGYGFGYGYLDRGETSTKSHSGSTKNGHTASHSRKQQRYVQPTKSTESLLLLPQYPTLSDSSLSCECLDATSPGGATDHNKRYLNGEQFSRDKASQTENRRIVNIQQAPEITRL
ncbi:uncharacterized protein LOC124364241 isoform X2 [Homalodisca vitripennis]|uniref:uncharacterized protein LOC124364241 isoform X2 n=1 Tax=Homalodisca vitripennis TaxID=197043 RepID=UPI001EEC3A35|nr:uncharacterized protein LOC124364241 isoform X2 [Homalodisca vitripennis]